MDVVDSFDSITEFRRFCETLDPFIGEGELEVAGLAVVVVVVVGSVLDCRLTIVSVDSCSIDDDNGI
jgi:hypothetical protein